MVRQLLLITLGTFVFFKGSAQWQAVNGPYGGTVHCITKVGNQIWAGTWSGIFTSADEGTTWNWYGPMKNFNCTRIYADVDTVIAQFSDINASYAFVAISYDGGASWANLTALGTAVTEVQIVGRALIFGTLISEDYGLTWHDEQLLNNIYNDVYVYSNDSFAILRRMDFNSYYTSLYRSTDGARTWQLLDSSQLYNDVYIDNNCFLITLNLMDSLRPNVMVRSGDMGNTWDTVLIAPTLGRTFYSPMYVNRKIQVYYNDTAMHVMVYSSTDGGITWTGPEDDKLPNFVNDIPLTNGDLLCRLNGKGIARLILPYDTFITPVTGLAAQQTWCLKEHKGVVFTCTDYDIFRSYDGGITWLGSGSNLAEINDLLFFGDTIIGVSAYYTARSYNHGLTWDSISFRGYPQSFRTVKMTNINGRIYAGKDSLYYSDDLGISWKTLPALRNTLQGEKTGVMKSFGDKLYCVTMEAAIFKYNYATNMWDSVTASPTSSSLDPTALYTVDSLLVMSGGRSLLVSADSGLTWHSSPLNGIPNYPNYLHAKMAPKSILSSNGKWLGVLPDGVYLSSDLGDSWQPIDSFTTPFTPSGGIVIKDGILYCGSYTHSVWRRSGVFGYITGNVYRDLNDNHYRDAGENGVPNVLTALSPSGFMATTDSLGNYSFYTDIVGDTLTAVNITNYSKLTPQYYLPAANDSNLNFALYLPDNVADLSVDIAAASSFNAGFPVNMYVTVTNKGTLVQPATVQLTLDSGLQYISASPVPDTVNGLTLSWITAPIQFFNSTSIRVKVRPLLSAFDSTLICNAIVSPVINDTLPQDNYYTFIDSVVGSFDPNDKVCKQGKYITPQQVENGEALEYTIRFQNEGTYQTTFIRIIDTLSSYLDLTTFKVISSSHQLTWSLTGNVVNFYFPNAVLAAPGLGSQGGQGFVKYSVKCKETTQLGMGVSNTASIYFDYNAPVVTNTISTLVYEYPAEVPETTSIHSATIAGIKVYPNPATEIIYIKAEDQDINGARMLIYNAMGTLVQTDMLYDNTALVYLNHLPAGMYFGHIIMEDNRQGVFRFIINQ